MKAREFIYRVMAKYGYYQTNRDKEFTTEVARYWTLKRAQDYADKQNEFSKEAHYFVEQLDYRTMMPVRTYR